MPRLSSKANLINLYESGVARAELFCEVNEIDPPDIEAVSRGQWHFDVCGYYRPETGIHISIEKCAKPATEAWVRNWNWPGSVTDRTPYGVIAHELGHHCDWVASDKKGKYFGNYGIAVCEESNEPPITSYAPNPSEWFAEVFRLFITNHALLKAIRPRAWELISMRFEPVSDDNWKMEICGHGTPPRILNNLKKKVREAQ